MRFLDSNIFLHAFLTPRRMLTAEEEDIKGKSKAIVKRVEKGEKIAMTTSHLSEVLNLIETGLGLRECLGFLAWVMTKESIEIYAVAREHYEASLPVAESRGISVNDALAFLFMDRHKLGEIYSFDKHFDGLDSVTRMIE